MSCKVLDHEADGGVMYRRASSSRLPPTGAAMTNSRRKKLPVLLTDASAERFIETADLSEFDLSGFRPMRFDFAPKDERANVRRQREAIPLRRGCDPA